MVRRYDEDLFEGTKMTFGEHLEELRVCLIRAFLGIAVGVAIGFAVGNIVVNWVKLPIEAAIVNYYQTRSATQLEQQHGAVARDTADALRERNLIHEDIWIEIAEFDRLLALRAAQQGTAAPTGGNELLEAESRGPSPGPSPSAPTRAASTSPNAAAASPNADQPSGESATVSAPTNLSEPAAPTLDMIQLRVWTHPQTNTRSFSIYEPFMIWLKASIIVGVALASPWTFYQVWLFVAAGLYPHEKSYVYIYLPISIALFVSGILLAYFGVFPPVLNFLLTFNSWLGIDPEPRINDWISFALLLPLGFGFSFQLPLVMLFLERLGIVSINLFVQHWRIAVLIICFVAMILTPAEPISMIMMAAPLCLLYFFGIGLCRWMPRHESPFGPGHDPA